MYTVLKMNTSKAKNGMFNPSTGLREPVVAANRGQQERNLIRELFCGKQVRRNVSERKSAKYNVGWYRV